MLQPGQRVGVLGSAVAGKQWGAPGEPGTIVETFDGRNIDGYYVRLDADSDRMIFCALDEVRLLPVITPALAATFDQVEARMARLVDLRPYVFRDTPQARAEEYVRRLTTFEGMVEIEVVALERALGVVFPQEFRAFLLRMGRHPGDLWRGSDIYPNEYAEYRGAMAEVIAETGISSFISPHTVVFLMHQGYSFMFFEAIDPVHAAVWGYTEGDAAPTLVHTTFMDYLEAEVRGSERHNEEMRASGGWFLTVHENGSESMFSPARSEGRRPMDEGDEWP